MTELEESRRKRLKREDNAAIEALVNLNGVPSTLPKQVIRTTRKVLQNDNGDVIIKGAWSRDEDTAMLKACKLYRFDWKKVASCVKGRSAKQCRDRYRLKLDPNINHGPWTPEEDEKLLQLHNEIGRSWTKIAKFLPGRTENAVKSRYSSLFRAKTKEWSNGEEQLLQTLHSQGVSFEIIAKQHLPHRSEHAVKKRWEKLLMKQIAKKIKQKLPTLPKNSSSECSQRSNVPKLNPMLAASTMTTVSRKKEIGYSNEGESTKTLISNPLVNTNILTMPSNGLVSCTSAFNTVNSSPRTLRIPNVGSLNSSLSASSTLSTGSNFLLPGIVGSTLESQRESDERKEAISPGNNENDEKKIAELRNKTLDMIKTKSSRLKRYSTSTTVMMQLIGEPLNIV